MLIGVLVRRFEGGGALRGAAGLAEKLRRKAAAGRCGRSRGTGAELAARLRLPTPMRGTNAMPSWTQLSSTSRTGWPMAAA